MGVLLETVQYQPATHVISGLAIPQWSAIGVFDVGGDVQALPAPNPGVVGITLIAATGAGQIIPICGIGALVWVRGDATINAGTIVIGKSGGQVTAMTGLGVKYPIGRLTTKIDAANQLGVLWFIPTATKTI
jgi:hypothetical protein